METFGFSLLEVSISNDVLVFDDGYTFNDDMLIVKSYFIESIFDTYPEQNQIVFSYEFKDEVNDFSIYGFIIVNRA